MCQFTIPFSNSSENLTNRAKQEIERAGGSFNGDASQGSFEVKTALGAVGGSYQVTGQEISMFIAKKPFLISCKRIEKELREVMM